MTTALRVVLEGPQAELGSVAAADVARLLLGVERAVARAAAGRTGRPAGRTGRRGATVEAATRLVFRAVEEGSVAAVLGLPAPASSGQGLPLDDKSLGEFAVLTTMAVLAGEGHDAAVAGALVQLADELGVGTRHERLVFIADVDSAPRREAPLDAQARDRLRASGAARVEDERPLPGILVEADFERSTARLRTPAGDGIAVTFVPEQADAIQQALRQQTEVEGRATYDAASDRLVSLELRRLVTAPQLPLYEESQDFWTHPSVEELARRQPAAATSDPGLLRDDEAADPEIDAFLAALEA